MKYENLKEATEICNQIGKNKKLLESLNSGRLTIILNEDEHNGRIMTIGADVHYEHDYTPLAVKFIEEIKTDLSRSNASLHERLFCL